MSGSCGKKAVSKVNGVMDVNVNLLANKMTVDLDEGVTNAQAVINAVESAGYGASEIGDKRKQNCITCCGGSGRK